ncbi:MAG: LPS assembly protein LptD [Bryobacteraceae bacterium]
MEGSQRKLRGNAVVETTEMLLKADEIDYDPKTGYAEARGNVKFDFFSDGTHIEADKVEYYLSTETGKYYNVRGSSPGKIEARPYILTTTNPFSFQGRWAERIKKQYILHDGFVTNCKLPNPWWVLRGREFDIIPGDRAIARNSTFWLRRVPLFYTPRFYKALGRAPRKSGFLQSHIGNSSRRGQMVDASYYWAINRSYDATYRAQLFTSRGLAQHVDFRGKPGETTDFNYVLYGVKDRGLLRDNGQRDKPQSGYLMSFNGRADLPKGFIARAQINYLSSFAFRQQFTESFYEAIGTEVHSIGNISKHWSSFGLNIVGTRIENFSSTGDNDKVSLRRLPSVEFNSRDRQINSKGIPVWVSYDASASLLRRNQLAFQTGNFVDRIDFEPRITSALRWKDLHLIPSLSLRETNYGATLGGDGRVSGNNLLRSTREFSADLILPSISRIFDSPPSWIGSKLKHVIEPRATYRYVNGVDDFHRIIRFDENDLLTNTNEVELSLTNRFSPKIKMARSTRH